MHPQSRFGRVFFPLPSFKITHAHIHMPSPSLDPSLGHTNHGDGYDDRTMNSTEARVQGKVKDNGSGYRNANGAQLPGTQSHYTAVPCAVSVCCLLSLSREKRKKTMRQLNKEHTSQRKEPSFGLGGLRIFYILRGMCWQLSGTA
uniref:Uncharacterized protein n=1 Tax=Anopheles melas TaxID=34690 RepID=A0A182TP94_9DIPT